MGPKKGNKKPPVYIVDGVDTSELAREKLEIYLLKVKEELDREREERTYYQLERDKIRTFWEITCQQLDEVKAEIRNRERVSEEIQEENDAILEFEKQKIKHLKYEQQCALAALRADNLVSLKSAKAEYAEQEQELLKDKRTIRQEMREKMLAAQDEFRREKLVHAEHMSKTRANFEEKAMEIEDKADKKMIETKEELAERQKKEITEAEERKNKQIAEIIEKHELHFSELKTYYNDITLNNLGLISSLKVQMEDVQKAKERSEKLARDAVAELKKIREPLEKLLADNNNLKEQLTNYAKDKAELKVKTRQVAILEKQLDVLKWEYEVLRIRYSKVLADRDELMTRFMRAVLEVQQRTSLKTALLETKLNNVKGKEMGLKELQALFKIKDTQLDDLRYEAARLRKAHDDLLATYEAKLANLGVPLDELGFQPLPSSAIAALSPRSPKVNKDSTKIQK